MNSLIGIGLTIIAVIIIGFVERKKAKKKAKKMNDGKSKNNRSQESL
jgi:hypothetical protein